MKGKRLWMTAIVLGMVAAVIVFAWPKSAPTAEALDFSTLMERVRDGRITRVELSDGATLRAFDADGYAYEFPNPRLDTFKHMLLLQGVQATEQASTGGGYGLLLIVLTAGAALLWRRRQAQTERGLAGGGIDSEAVIPSTTFEDVAANDEALDAMRDLVSFLREPAKYAGYGARIPRGVLLYGPPGTGKTLMARALAGEANAPFFAVNGADFVEMYVGVGASRVRRLFAKARKAERAVVFIDEIDAIGKKRDNRSDEREQTLNALLSEMSGFRDDDGVIVLAATNRIDTLDEALLRAGRFDRQIEVPLPTYEERLKILRVHAGRKPLAQSVSLEALAAQTALFSGAKLESVLNEAAILAAKRGAAQIAEVDVDSAYDAILCGVERRSAAVRDEERRLTAAHEAGHALATALLLPDSRIRRVTIVPSSKGAAGYSMAVQPEKLFHHRRELLHHIAVALAGRAAEELTFGADYVGTGAANDIEKAASLARRMVAEWGMLPESDSLYLFSQNARDRAAQAWLSRGYELARSLLAAHRDGHARLTALLLERESVDEQEVLSCLQAMDA